MSESQQDLYSLPLRGHSNNMNLGNLPPANTNDHEILKSNPLLPSDMFYNDSNLQHMRTLNAPNGYHGADNFSSFNDGPSTAYLSNSNSYNNTSSGLAEEDESYDTSLFLGDLSVYSTEKDIRKLFSPYGIIERIRIKRGSSGKPHLSYGFITFRERASAEEALKELNGVMFLGRALRLGWAEPKSQIKIPKQKTEVLTTAQIHVSYISKQIDMLISEETLRSIFSRFGQVVDVAIKKSQFDKRLKLQNGYGFIHFPLTTQGLQAAVNATFNVHQVTIDRVTYDCSLSRYLDEFQLPAPQIFPEFAHREIKPINLPQKFIPPTPPTVRPAMHPFQQSASFPIQDFHQSRGMVDSVRGFSPAVSAPPRVPYSEAPRTVPPSSSVPTYPIYSRLDQPRNKFDEAQSYPVQLGGTNHNNHYLYTDSRSHIPASYEPPHVQSAQSNPTLRNDNVEFRKGEALYSSFGRDQPGAPFGNNQF